MGIIIAFVILGVIIVGIVSGGVAIYNRLVMLKYNVDKNFANIDVILKQRVDEIPNLIAVVKKTQGYEESLLNQLTELRTAFLSSRSTDEKVQLANEVGKLLNSFFAVSENYPELKAVESFRTLQLRVSDLEDMLSDRRELYNESVNMYNIGIHEMPALLFARPMGYTDKPLLHISEEEKNMTEFVSDILNYLQNNENAQGVVVALAAFGVPLFSFLLYLLFRILRIKVGAMASRALAALATGYTLFGFITQIILLFSGVPALKMALIWLAMIIVYGVFVLFNRRMIYKILSTFNETKNSGQESLES